MGLNDSTSRGFADTFFSSDARSGSIVDDRIRPTLETGSAIGSTKPVLLVIDEIDGATGAGDNVRQASISTVSDCLYFHQSNTFIHKLVQLIQARPTKKRKKRRRHRSPYLHPSRCKEGPTRPSTYSTPYHLYLQ